MSKILTENVEVALKKLFHDGIAGAFSSIPTPEILISLGKSADYQCNNAMALVKALKSSKINMTPSEVGEAIIKSIPENDLIDRAEPTPQGFINIYIAQQWVCEAIKRVSKNGIQPPQVNHVRTLVDFSSPNIAKEMHVGHLRSTIIGDSICRLLEFCGHPVRRINHVGDWGTQFGMLILYLRETYPDFLSNPPNISDLVEFYRAAKARFDADPEFKDKARLEVVRLQALEPENIKAWKLLCDVSRRDFDEIYSRLGVHLEERGESFYNPFIPDVIKLLDEANQTHVSDGASIIVSTEPKPIKDIDAKEFTKLLSSHLIQLRKGSDQPEYSPALIDGLKKINVLTGDEGSQVVKLSKNENKPLAKFDVLKDAGKLAKMMEPLYFKVNLDPAIRDVFAAQGVISEDGLSVNVPRFAFPLLVRKSDGGYTYDTTDLAGMWHRFVHEDYQRVIYVTDLGQFEHFRMVAQVAEDMKWITGDKTWAHAGFGLVSGEDGKKLKTRSGDTVKLRDLLDEAVERCEKTLRERESGDQKQGHSEEDIKELSKRIGYGAVKYFDLKQNRTTDYSFSYDKMLDTQGNTAVYMLYSYARIMSIQRKAGVSEAELASAEVKFESEKEKNLAICALRFDQTIRKTADDLYLNHITDFVYELTAKLSEFYADCRVIDHPLQNSRLILLDTVAKTMKQSLNILGIEVADKL